MLSAQVTDMKPERLPEPGRHCGDRWAEDELAISVVKQPLRLHNYLLSNDTDAQKVESKFS